MLHILDSASQRTLPGPLARVGLCQVLGQDEGSQRVAGRKKRRLREAPLHLLDANVDIIGESCAVALWPSERQPCAPNMQQLQCLGTLQPDQARGLQSTEGRVFPLETGFTLSDPARQQCCDGEFYF